MAEKKSDSLYFIAIIPPHPVYEEALELKRYFKNQYQSKAALNSPPHITLHMPFKWKAVKENDLIQKLEQFFVYHDPFEIILSDFKAFHPRVIFIEVIKDESLATLQKELKRFCKAELNLFNADYKEYAYHPHITLAFRDLKKPAFIRSWDEFKEKKFERAFITSSIALLKHNGNEWKVLKELTLKN